VTATSAERRAASLGVVAAPKRMGANSIETQNEFNQSPASLLSSKSACAESKRKWRAETSFCDDEGDDEEEWGVGVADKDGRRLPRRRKQRRAGGRAAEPPQTQSHNYGALIHCGV